MQATGYIKASADTPAAAKETATVRKKVGKNFSSLLDKLKVPDDPAAHGKLKQPGLKSALQLAGKAAGLNGRDPSALEAGKQKSRPRVLADTQAASENADAGSIPSVSKNIIKQPEAADAAINPAAAKKITVEAGVDDPIQLNLAKTIKDARNKGQKPGSESVEAAQLAYNPAANGQQQLKPAAKNGLDGATNDSEGKFSVSSTLAKNGARLTVVDMRLKAGKERNAGGEGAAGQGGLAKEFSLAEQASEKSSFLAEGGRQIVSNGFQPNAGNSTNPESLMAQSRQQSLADHLASQIRDSGAADIVKAAQIVLHGNDAGLIRMQLEPESLGKVKIELKIADNKISGRIVVESDLAGQAFKDSLESLRDAFAASGMETTALEVEVRDGGQGQQGTADGSGEEGKDPYYSQHVRTFESAVPPAGQVSSRDGLVNVII
ncbi:MAG: flagellar hook-length control protein FliK [Spirochaetes bacterium]|nr:flagellar hook-length control protein FliK [Spirochaetota bacterium]MBU0955333.1 flagellar hook-length control protein FliK [Spirochaetota bacterium]